MPSQYFNIILKWEAPRANVNICPGACGGLGVLWSKVLYRFLMFLAVKVEDSGS